MKQTGGGVGGVVCVCEGKKKKNKKTKNKRSVWGCAVLSTHESVLRTLQVARWKSEVWN